MGKKARVFGNTNQYSAVRETKAQENQEFCRVFSVFLPYVTTKAKNIIIKFAFNTINLYL